uniref:hypothetical protein n=1 Tax=Cohnella sp. GbtcB17 TaxID=2824762 RepID=UPI001C2FC096
MMLLKNMTVLYTHVPEAEATLYYACGEQDGKMYETHYTLQDATLRLLNAFQIDELVTRELAANICEL